MLEVIRVYNEVGFMADTYINTQMNIKCAKKIPLGRVCYVVYAKTGGILGELFLYYK